MLRNNIRKNIHYQAELYKTRTSFFKRLVVALLEIESKKLRNLKRVLIDLEASLGFKGKDWVLAEVKRNLGSAED